MLWVMSTGKRQPFLFERLCGLNKARLDERGCATFFLACLYTLFLPPNSTLTAKAHCLVHQHYLRSTALETLTDGVTP